MQGFINRALILTFTLFVMLFNTQKTLIKHLVKISSRKMERWGHPKLNNSGPELSRPQLNTPEACPPLEGAQVRYARLLRRI